VPESNLDIVERGYQAYARGEAAAMLADLHPEAVIYRELPDGATFRGPEGLVQAIAEWIEDFTEFTFELVELFDAPADHVIAHVRQTAVGARSGAPIGGDFWFVHELRDGAVVRLDMLTTRAKAEAVAGV
jgi:ketosteroid isomerase-like protein